MSAPHMPTLHMPTLEEIKAGAIVVSGFWAAWTFHKLQKVRKAELDVRETEVKLLSQQPQLGIDLTLLESPMPSEQARRCLRVSVILRSEGGRNLKVEFDDSPLMVGRILLGDGNPEIENVRRFAHFYLDPGSRRLVPSPHRTFKVGQKRQFDFAVPISEPGVYLVQFAAWYYGIPFDEEQEKSEKSPEKIFAFEQQIFLSS